MKFNDNESKTIVGALVEYGRRDGLEFFNNPSKINGLLADLFPNEMERERTAIKYGLNIGIGKAIIELHNGDDEGISDIKISQIKQRLKDVIFDDSLTEFTLNTFIEAIDIVYSEKKVVEEALKKGNPAVQFLIGRVYEEKIQDYEKAIEWYEKAAAQGDKEAAFRLGCIYEEKIGDNEEAKEWYEKAKEWFDEAAVREDWSTLCRLRDFYAKIGDDGKTKEWYEKVYEKANQECEENPLRLRFNSRGTDYDEIIYIETGDFYRKIGENEKAKELYEKAIERYEKKSDELDDDRGEVAYKLGYVYEKKIGDNEKAIEWYEKADYRYNDEAKCRLATIYEEIGDYEKAKEWYEKATDRELFQWPNGIDAVEFCEKAIEWYKKAASQGDEEASYRLGLLCEGMADAKTEWEGNGFDGEVVILNGEETKEWYEKAIEWYEKAASQGDKEALCNLGHVYGDKIKDYEKAIEWYEKAAERGDEEALLEIGSIYKNQIGDTEKAIEWYKKAAERGSIIALSRLRYIYEKEIGDYEKAIEWYEKEVENKVKTELKERELYFSDITDVRITDEEGCLGIGYICEKKLHDNDSAINWYKKAAYHWNIEAMLRLGNVYERMLENQEAKKWYAIAVAQIGDGKTLDCFGLRYALYNYVDEEKEYEKAIDLYEIIAAQGDEEALSSLGYLYEEEIQDYEKAIEWYEKAAEQGDEEAPFRLGCLYEEKIEDNKKAIYWYKKAGRNTTNTDKRIRMLIRIGNVYEKIGDNERAIRYYNAVLEDFKNKVTGWHSINDKYENLNTNVFSALGKKSCLAAFCIGNMYEHNGDCGMFQPNLNKKEEYEKAIEWYAKAAVQRDTDNDFIELVKKFR